MDCDVEELSWNGVSWLEVRTNEHHKAAVVWAQCLHHGECLQNEL